MNDLKKNFIKFTLDHEILRFGSFVLKSGRKSPYFFNTGLCCSGSLLNSLSKFYAQYIVDNFTNFDFIFGPAYKGITLSSSIASILESNYKIDKHFSSNRKETKTHGDKGLFLGYQPTGNALLVDDVISTGTSLIESIKLINASNSNVVGVLVAFDRMEVGKSDRASVELSTRYSLEVHSLINLDDILEFVMENNKYKQYTKNILDYIKEYKK